MLEKPPDLSPDLEWMLQSGQASDAALVEALVREHHAELYSLLLDAQCDAERAERIALRALADAVLNAHRYPVGLGVRSWLFSLVRERNVEWLEPDVERLADLPSPDISDEEIERVNAEIHRIIYQERRKRRLFAFPEVLIAGLVILGIFFAERWMSSVAPVPTPVPTEINTALVTQIVFISVTPTPQATPTPFPERAILYIAEEGDTLARVAEKTGLEAVLLQALNGFEPKELLQSGQAVMLGLGGMPIAHITPTQVTPGAPPEPLTSASNQNEILQRIIESERYFHTLWADAQVIEYGMPGYTGPPRVKRLQVWVSRPSFSLALLGDPDGSLEIASVSNSGHTYTIDYLTGEHWVYIRYGLDLMHLDALIQQSFSMFEIGSEQEIVGIEPVAGREALVLEIYHLETSLDRPAVRVRLGRYWIDTLTGVILRLQRFEKDETGEFLLSEIIIDEIAFDVDLPNSLFDQYQPLPSRLALNYSGDPYPEEGPRFTPTWVPPSGRELLPRLAPPPGFDPSSSRLSFQWTHGSAFDNYLSTRTDIFADRYYLGSIGFADPDRLICTRSPDGRKIAYSEWLEVSPYGTAPLRWLDLNDLSRIFQPLEEIQAQVLAFSPDSSRLAFLGGESVNDWGLYVLDLASGDSKRVRDLSGGDHLMWSPDGKYLALAGAENPNSGWRLLVIDAGTGEIAYQGPIEWGLEGQIFLPEDSPVAGWMLPMFPPRRSAVEACARPPE